MHFLFANTNKASFKLVGKLIVVQATVQGQSGNFILDTGVSNLILNAVYFEGRQTDKVFCGINGSTEKIQMDFSIVKFAGYKWKNVYSEIFSLCHLERHQGVRFLGMIGGRMLRNYKLLIDYQKAEIDVRKYDKQEVNDFALSGRSPDYVIPFKYKGGTPCIAAQIGNIDLRFTIDTGA